jgi:hypothetical protein
MRDPLDSGNDSVIRPALLILPQIILFGCAYANRPTCAAGPQPLPEHVAVLPDTTGPGTIRGTLVSLPDSAPLVSAVVRVANTSLGTYTTADGRFQITGAPLGGAVLEFRHIAYWAANVPVTLSADHGILIHAGVGRSCAEGVSLRGDLNVNGPSDR